MGKPDPNKTDPVLFVAAKPSARQVSHAKLKRELCELAYLRTILTLAVVCVSQKILSLQTSRGDSDRMAV